MQAVTDQEMRDFLVRHENLGCKGKEVHFSDPEAKSIRISLHVSEPHQLLYLARLVAHLRYQEMHFSSASLWITQWGVWNPLEEAIAFKTIEQFRRGFGENRSIETAPGHFFRHNEFVESISCLLQPMLVGWDAYYIPQWTWGTLDYFVFVSHDHFIGIETRSSEMYRVATEILQSHNWIKWQ